MALALTYTERNDNELLTLTDVTTTWGVAPLPAIAAITTLTLDVTITTSDGTETVCTQIDLVAEESLDGSSTQADLVYELSALTLGLGAVGDELPDGVYDFIYIVDEGLGTEVSFTESILVQGRVRRSVYELLRTLPVTYNCQDCKTKEIMDVIFCYGLLNTLESNGYVAKNEELINQLYTLERIITNGSSYSW
jgi:hypothetical protein